MHCHHTKPGMPGPFPAWDPVSHRKGHGIECALTPHAHALPECTPGVQRRTPAWKSTAISDNLSISKGAFDNRKSVGAVTRPRLLLAWEKFPRPGQINHEQFGTDAGCVQLNEYRWETRAPRAVYTRTGLVPRAVPWSKVGPLNEDDVEASCWQGRDLVAIHQPYGDRGGANWAPTKLHGPRYHALRSLRIFLSPGTPVGNLLRRPGISKKLSRNASSRARGAGRDCPLTALQIQFKPFFCRRTCSAVKAQNFFHVSAESGISSRRRRRPRHRILPAHPIGVRLPYETT